MLKLLFKPQLLVLLALAVGIAVYKPEIIPNEAWRTTVIEAREGILHKNPETTNNVLGVMVRAKDEVIQWSRNTKLPPALTGEKQEIVVDDYVEGLSNQIKQLPSEQLLKVKTQFCQDVINAATAAATLTCE